MPQLHDSGLQLHFIGGQLAWRQRVFGAADGQRHRLDVVAGGEQLGNAAFGVQNAFALHFGRVRGQHRRDKAARQRVGNRLRRNPGPAQPRQGDFDAALLRVASAFMDDAAADVMPVFGQIGQMRKIGEGANHADGLVAAQALEQGFQRLVGFFIGIAAERDGELAHLLDQLVSGHAFLVADHVAQNAPEQADVFDQRALVAALAPGGGGFVRGFAGSSGRWRAGGRAVVARVFFDGFRARGSKHLGPLVLRRPC